MVRSCSQLWFMHAKDTGSKDVDTWFSMKDVVTPKSWSLEGARVCFGATLVWLVPGTSKLGNQSIGVL